MKKLTLLVSLTALVVGLTFAAVHQSQSLFSGDATTIMYQATTAAKTFTFDDAWQTNVFYTSYGPRVAVRATAENSVDVFYAQNHGFVNTDRVYVTARTMPSGVSALTVYFIIGSAAGSFQISTTSGGSAVTFTTDGADIIVSSITKASYPQGTNTASGAIYASWAEDIKGFADANGNIASPNVSVSLLGDVKLTNTVTFTFVRSGDGVNFGLSAQDQFSFALTPTTSLVTVVTNLPAQFLTGSRLIKPYTVVLATNPGGAGILGLTRISLNGFVP